MFFPETQLNIWLYTGVADMRKSYDGLAALVKNQMQDNPLIGDLFVFTNRRRNAMKILYFDRTGYCIWMKRLEAGVFQLPEHQSIKTALDYSQLTMILEGIDLYSVKRRKRYTHKNKGVK